jgi:hypothetical protein
MSSVSAYAEGMALGLVMPITVAAGTHLTLQRVWKSSVIAVTGCSVYAYSRGMLIFVSILSTMLIVLFAFAGATMRHPLRQSVDATVFTYALVLTIHYVHHYRIVVSDVFVQAGAVRFSSVHFKDVARAVRRSGRYGGGSVWLYGNNGERVTLWSSVDNFNACLSEIKSRLPAGARVE